MAVIAGEVGGEVRWDTLDQATRDMFEGAYPGQGQAEWEAQHAAEQQAPITNYQPSAPQVPTYVSPGTNTGLPPDTTG